MLLEWGTIYSSITVQIYDKKNYYAKFRKSFYFSIYINLRDINSLTSYQHETRGNFWLRVRSYAELTKNFRPTALL